MQKFDCYTNGKYVGVVRGKNAAEALETAQELSASIDRVEEAKAPAPKAKVEKAEEPKEE